jgi:hypothetical protein
MNKRLCDRLLLLGSLLVLAFVACAPASADEAPARRRHHRYDSCWLPPERHVIEVVRYGYIYIINGFRFTAPAPCPGWVAGDRIWLLEGSWHAVCDVAVFYNATRCNTCALLCG